MGVLGRLARLAALLLLLIAPAHAQDVDRDALLRHIRALSVDIGVRKGGSPAESRAIGYAALQLRHMGYEPTVQHVPLPGGRSTQNVVAELKGTTGKTWLVGAHIDSKPPSPGANDNASGVAAVLELARVLRQAPPADTVRFVLFGSEEVIGRRADDHHYGSRYYARTMPLADFAGVIVIDSVAAGSDFVIGSTRKVSPLSVRLRKTARDLGMKPQAKTDPGWSDHEAFEKRGVPAAYVRWRIDDTLHTKGDSFAHVQAWKIKAAADVVLAFLRAAANQ